MTYQMSVNDANVQKRIENRLKGREILRNICILLSFTTLATSCDKYPASLHERKNDFPGLSSPLFPSLFSYNKWLKTITRSKLDFD